MTEAFFCAIINTSKLKTTTMKNLIISTFLILAMIVGGSMNNVPASVASLFGSIEASAQLKNPKACDSATGQVPYGEFVVNSATIEVVERDGKAGSPLPKNILVDAIKKSGFQDLAGKTDDQIIELAVKEQRCVISPVNYVAVVTNSMSATRLVFCGANYTTRGNTFTKANKKIVADTEGYGAYNVEVQCKMLPCPSGTITIMTNGVQECKTPDTTCPVGQLKDKDGKCTTPPAPICPPGQSGTYPVCQMPCPPGTTGTFMPNCVVNPPIPAPEPVCPAGSVKNPTTNICEVPCPQGTTKNAQNICEAPKAPETPAKKNNMGLIIGGIAALGIGAALLLGRRKPAPTPPPTGDTPPPSSPTVCRSASTVIVYNTQAAASRQLALAKAAGFGSATVTAGQSISTKKDTFTLRCGAQTPPSRANVCRSASTVIVYNTQAAASRQLALAKAAGFGSATVTAGQSISTKKDTFTLRCGARPTRTNTCPSPQNGGFSELSTWLRGKNNKVTQAEYTSYVNSKAKSWETPTRKNIRAVAGCKITFEKPSIPQSR